MVSWYPNPKKWAQIRQEVMMRDKNQCQKCGTPRNLQVHHIVARVNGGSHELVNLITLCPSCHASEENKENLQGIKLKCSRVVCGWIWFYAGKSETRASCPRCKTSVVMAKNEVKEE